MMDTDVLNEKVKIRKEKVRGARTTGEFERLREEQELEFSSLVEKLVKQAEDDKVPFPAREDCSK